MYMVVAEYHGGHLFGSSTYDKWFSIPVKAYTLNVINPIESAAGLFPQTHIYMRLHKFLSSSFFYF